MTAPAHGDGTPDPFADTWVVMPTYDEAENLEAIAAAVLENLPGCTLLVVDDNSPDGTGQIADRLAAGTGRVRVLHRAGKQGLGKAYIAGFRCALGEGARRVVQMDADWSHDPGYLPAMVSRLAAPDDGSAGAPADVVIGSRYVPGGGVTNWGLMRRFISRGGSVFAGTVLRLQIHDLTAGFKANPQALSVLQEADRILRELGSVLGILMEEPAIYFEKDRRREAEKRGLLVSEIDALIAERLKARAEKNWKRADEIRAELAAKGIALKDSKTATTWMVESKAD